LRALTELKKECISRANWPVMCQLCWKRNPKQLILHHFWYSKNSVTYNQFENNDDGRLKYYAHLLDEIKKDPKNFIPLCVDCHTLIHELAKLPLHEYASRIHNLENEEYYRIVIQRTQVGQYPKVFNNDPDGLDSIFWGNGH